MRALLRIVVVLPISICILVAFLIAIAIERAPRPLVRANALIRRRQ
jgi:hypothetical protein